MFKRKLSPVATSPEWGRQMRFIAGPRQSGKTTLAKNHLKQMETLAFYYNWDKREIRNKHHQGIDLIKERLLESPKKTTPTWICFDEIHKMPKWKNILKSYFDEYETNIRFLVTGSARLDLFRRSGDSLAGRYFLFHLFPLTLFEITSKTSSELSCTPSAETFIEERISLSRKNNESSLEALLQYGGFPEPFLKSNSRFLHRWQEDYLDRLIREDIRNLTRIADLENISALISLLPEKVGSPLSINSLRNDIDVNHQTVKNYLRALKLCYATFELHVYSQKINRSIKKEKKLYLFDWSKISDESKRFENYVACDLLSWVTLWSDQGIGEFGLSYVRNRSGQECDFLITRDKKPWLLLEAKLKDQRLASHLYLFSKRLGNIPIIQLVKEKGVLCIGKNNDFRISASRFLSA